VPEGPESVEYYQARQDAEELLDTVDVLHRLRVGQGISVREAARQMGMRPKQFERFETGIDSAHASTMQRYARVVGHRLVFEIQAGEDGRG